MDPFISHFQLVDMEEQEADERLNLIADGNSNIPSKMVGYRFPAIYMNSMNRQTEKQGMPQTKKG